MNLDGNTIINDLDIFSKVGYAAAHDEHVPFTVKNGQLSVNGGKGMNLLITKMPASVFVWWFTIWYLI